MVELSTISVPKPAKKFTRFQLKGAGTIYAVNGRLAWALIELVDAAARGVTPIDNPGPRWSAYVHTLRNEYGLEIETVREPHGGPYPGCHARYVLLSQIEFIG